MTENSAGIYLPRTDTFAARTIARGSGIVGSFDHEWNHNMWADDPARLVIDFEGNKYGASNIVTFYDRVAHAYDRHATAYPTIARLVVNPADVVRVGTFYPSFKMIDLEPIHLIGVVTWLIGPDGESPNLHVEVRPGSAVFA